MKLVPLQYLAVQTWTTAQPGKSKEFVLANFLGAIGLSSDDIIWRVFGARDEGMEVAVWTRLGDGRNTKR